MCLTDQKLECRMQSRFFSFGETDIARICIGLVLVFACPWTSAAEPSEQAEDLAAISVQVTDAQGRALENADVCVRQWTGKAYDVYPQAQVAQKEGRVNIGNLSIDEMLYLRVTADGYAPSMQSLLSLTGGELRNIEFRLSKPATGWIDVVSSAGEPIEGAWVTMLKYTDLNKNEVYLTPGTASVFDYRFATSDKLGRLMLPPLPHSSRADITLIHPDWKSIALENLVASDGRLGVARLDSGARVSIELESPEGGVIANGQKVFITMIGDRGSSKQPTHVRDAFPLVAGRAHFTAYAIEYQQLSLEMDGYLVAPQLYNYPESRDSSLDLRSGELKALRFTAIPKAKFRGRLIDADGRGVAKVDVLSTFAIDEHTPWMSETNETDIYRRARQWSSSGSAETDESGNYEIELARRRTHIEIIREGYFSDPHTLEIDFSRPDNVSIPDMRLLKVPTLRGIVRDEVGLRVEGAYLRMRHRGYGDTDPVCQSTSDGAFALKLNRIPYSPSGGLLTNVFVVAMDARRGLGGIAEVDLKDSKAIHDMSIRLEPRSADWFVDVVKTHFESDAKMKAARRESAARSMAEFSSGAAGNSVPSMREGTWLNTDAKSLDDFRGKYVLLDFWFIGCGPCHRDMPNVRLAHRLFSEMGFSVVGVHRTGETPQSVQTFADKNAMDYPIVVDDANGTITEQFRYRGVTGYPTYILLGPDGRIIQNDAIGTGSSLRQYKIELIYQAIRK